MANINISMYLMLSVQECGGQLRKRMDIFCSTSVRSRAWQNSSKHIIWSLLVSASKIVRSAMLVNCSSLILAPTIMCSMANNSSLEILPSLSKSYIENANLNFSSLLLSLFSLFFLIGLKCASTLMNCKKFTLSSWLSAKKECTIRSLSGLIANSGILKKSSLDRVPQSFLSSDVNREYSLSIWFGVNPVSS